jgi:hypothetical protein
VAFPQSIDPTEPVDTVIATVGPAELRAIKQFLADVFGLPIAPAQIAAAAMSIATTGVPTLPAGTLLTSNPTAPLGVVTKQYADGLAGTFQPGFSTSSSSGSSLTSVGNQIFMFGFALPAVGVSHGFLINVTSAPGGVNLNSFGLYNAAGNLVLNTAPGTIATVNTGRDLFVPVQTLPLVLPAGIYFFAWVNNGGLNSMGGPGHVSIVAGDTTGYQIYASSNSNSSPGGLATLPSTITVPVFNSFGAGWDSSIWPAFALY